jgi:hypothetical protein
LPTPGDAVVRQRHELDDLLTARMGGGDAYEAMRRACDELLTQVSPIRPPVRLAPLARLMGAELSYGDHGGVGREEAAIYFRDGKLFLWVSRKRFENVRTQKRARFSIAHELGHLLLFRMLGPEFLDHAENDSQSYALTERLCDFAASQILMPRSVLQSAVRERPFTEEGLKSLGELFVVSTSAMLRAVADLVPAGAILELRKFSRRRGELSLWRVWSATTSSSAKDLASWLPTGCTLKHLRGMRSPDEIPSGRAVRIGEITLIRGRIRSQREAIATRAASPPAPSPDLLPRSETPLAHGRLIQDESAGRVLLLVGEPGGLDAVWSGREPLE